MPLPSLSTIVANAAIVEYAGNAHEKCGRRGFDMPIQYENLTWVFGFKVYDENYRTCTGKKHVKRTTNIYLPFSGRMYFCGRCGLTWWIKPGGKLLMNWIERPRIQFTTDSRQTLVERTEGTDEPYPS